ncbi:MAG: glycosyltransferase family 2 protein, partial [Bdellovibrionales bacterium]|nr:glycosyltransferase family 2 protein [Bdellovibrionales bacterium]
MQASIIIPTHQRHSSLLALLSSLHLQDLPKSEWEAIIVSNQQDPRLRKGLKSFFKTTCRRRSSYHFLEVGKLGVNRARNLGIAHAKAKYLFFLDDDCFVRDPSYLRRGVELLDKWTEVSAIGGPYSLREKSNTCEQVYNSICRHWLESSVRKSGFTTNLVGGNMVIRQSVFAGDLRFNESIIFGGAETEFNCRLLRQGYRLKYDPTFTGRAHVWYPSPPVGERTWWKL